MSGQRPAVFPFVVNFPLYIRRRQAWVDQALNSCLPASGRRPALLHRAMRYSVFAGGKRLRPILVLAAMESVFSGKSAGPAVKKALPIAAAVELIHTYSLVHDDLPAMDDDDWRRGRPTNHKVFGEAAAILAGDSLLTAAFELLGRPVCRSHFDSDTLVRIVAELGEAAGSAGMAGGQMMDIARQGSRTTEKAVRWIHSHKTGALIRGSVRIGGILGGATAGELSALSRYGEKIGLAFQIADDILDVEGDPGLMGKRARKDHAVKKATYPVAVGIQRARDASRRLAGAAVAALKMFDHRADPLRELAVYMVDRKH